MLRCREAEMLRGKRSMCISCAIVCICCIPPHKPIHYYGAWLIDVRAEEELSEVTRGGEHSDKGHHKQPQAVDGVPAGNVGAGDICGGR